jgi:hypothetical protein
VRERFIEVAFETDSITSHNALDKSLFNWYISVRLHCLGLMLRIRIVCDKLSKWIVDALPYGRHQEPAEDGCTMSLRKA